MGYLLGSEYPPEVRQAQLPLSQEGRKHSLISAGSAFCGEFQKETPEDLGSHLYTTMEGLGAGMTDLMI